MIYFKIPKQELDFAENLIGKQLYPNAQRQIKENDYILEYDGLSEFENEDWEVGVVLTKYGFTFDQMDINDIGRRLEKMIDSYLTHPVKITD